MNSNDPHLFYVSRDKEIHQLSENLKKFNNVFLFGEPGVGKTFLVKRYQHVNPLNFNEVEFINAHRLDFDLPDNGLIDQTRNNQNKLLIIDGFDEVLSTEAKKQVVHTLEYARAFGVQIILTSRNIGVPASIIANSVRMKLGNLTEEDISKFYVEFVPRPGYSVSHIMELMRINHPILHTPLGLISTIELIKRLDLSSTALLELLNNKLTYENELLFLPEPQIIQLEQPKIITDVGLINNSLIELVAKEPQFIYSMSPRQFEEFVAELFEKDGYKVTLTQQSHDGGKDLFIIEEKRVGKFVYYVECKQYAQNRPVGVHLVRELYGTVIADRATAGLLVTSSYFSKEAKQFTQVVKSQLSLIDYGDLTKWVKEIQTNK